MAQVTLYKIHNGKIITTSKTEEGAPYYIRTYGWSYTRPSSPAPPPPPPPPPRSAPPPASTTDSRIAEYTQKWQNISGITGFVRVQGQNTIYAIGPGGQPVSSEHELAWITAQTGVPLTSSQVEIVSPEKATSFGITVPGYTPPISPGGTTLPVDDTILPADDVVPPVDDTTPPADDIVPPNVTEVPENIKESPLGTDKPMIRFHTDPTPNDDTTDQNTVWLYNSEKKTYRPIASPEALMALLKVDTIEEAFSHVNVLPSSAMRTPEWEGSMISSKDEIKDDGLIPDSSDIIPGTELNTFIETYGRERVPDDAEDLAGKLIGVILTPARQKGDISDKVFRENLLENPTQLAIYASAILYGDYDVPTHIYADLKAKTLAEQGQSEYADFSAFDEKIKLEEWLKTPDGQKFTNDPNIVVPEGILNIDVGMFSNPIFKIPDSAFSTLIKPIDIDSSEFKAEAEKIQASYYDIMMQKAEAETEQAKAIADSNWNIFKKNLEKKYGIELSNNAKEAWGQLQDLFSGSSQRGLSGTGLEREVKDKYLGSVRDRDQILRESKIDEKELEERNRLLKTGSSAEIAAFVTANPEKAKLWGLVPDDEHKNWFSKANLKSLYPDMTDSEIAVIAGMIIDPETGYFRSEIYQNLYSNKYNLGEQKKTYQWEKLYQQKLDAERKAYEPYTKQNPFSSFYDKDAISSEFKVGGDDMPVSTSDTSSTDVPGSQQTMRDFTKDNIVTPSSLEQIKSIFGSTWEPSKAFKDSKDYLGAVRVTDTDKVYGIGSGDPHHFLKDEFSTRFGTSDQTGIVGEVNSEQAKRLKIPGYF